MRPQNLTDEQWRDEVLRRMLNTPPKQKSGKPKPRFKDQEIVAINKGIEKACMCCQKLFFSEGVGNRLCKKCAYNGE